MKSIEVAQLKAPGSCSQSVCEACGASFSCGAQEASGCWCGEVKLTESVRAELRERYRSCLCRACLERAAADEKQDEPEKIFN